MVGLVGASEGDCVSGAAEARRGFPLTLKSSFCSGGGRSASDRALARATVLQRQPAGSRSRHPSTSSAEPQAATKSSSFAAWMRWTAPSRRSRAPSPSARSITTTAARYGPLPGPASLAPFPFPSSPPPSEPDGKNAKLANLALSRRTGCEGAGSDPNTLSRLSWDWNGSRAGGASAPSHAAASSSSSPASSSPSSSSSSSTSSSPPASPSPSPSRASSSWDDPVGCEDCEGRPPAPSPSSFSPGSGPAACPRWCRALTLDVKRVPSGETYATSHWPFLTPTARRLASTCHPGGSPRPNCAAAASRSSPSRRAPNASASSLPPSSRGEAAADGPAGSAAAAAAAPSSRVAARRNCSTAFLERKASPGSPAGPGGLR